MQYYESKVKTIVLALKNLYLDKTNSIISEEEFLQLKIQLENDKDKYHQQIKELEEKLKHNNEQKGLNDIEDIIKQFLTFKNPSKQILIELIKKIEIMKNKQIKVYLNFNLNSEG